MILSLHILFALLSVIFSSVSLFKPSRLKLYSSYFLAATTLSSGIALVLVEPATMVRACIVGIVYFVAVSYIIYQTREKLLLQEQRTK